MKGVLALFAILIGVDALAARTSTVVVDEASIFEFPRKNSRQIGSAKKDEKLMVGNQPIEGFYKLKIKTGEFGWVSGNDILVEAPQEGAGGVPEATETSEASAEEKFHGDRFRIQLGYGIQNLAYGGLSTHYAGTGSLNFGTHYRLEIQRKIYYLLYWGLRGALTSADTGIRDKPDGTRQRIKQAAIPVEIGVIFHPLHWRRFRVGLAGYVGASFGTYSSVQTIGTEDLTVKYASVDPIGTASVQATYGFTRAFGVFGELAYRYHRTGTHAATSAALGSVPAFQIDYSGYYMSGGLEIRF